MIEFRGFQFNTSLVFVIEIGLLFLMMMMMMTLSNWSLLLSTAIVIITVFITVNNVECYDTSLDFDLASLIPDDYNPNVRPLNPYGQNSK